MLAGALALALFGFAFVVSVLRAGHALRDWQWAKTEGPLEMWAARHDLLVACRGSATALLGVLYGFRIAADPHTVQYWALVVALIVTGVLVAAESVLYLRSMRSVAGILRGDLLLPTGEAVVSVSVDREGIEPSSEA